MRRSGVIAQLGAGKNLRDKNIKFYGNLGVGGG